MEAPTIDELLETFDNDLLTNEIATYAYSVGPNLPLKFITLSEIRELLKMNYDKR